MHPAGTVSVVCLDEALTREATACVAPVSHTSPDPRATFPELRPTANDPRRCGDAPDRGRSAVVTEPPVAPHRYPARPI
ncbi:hypothetical protein JCM33774_49130 [Actinophytocola sp. KF-1]